MPVTTDKLEIHDITLKGKKDEVIVRLANGDALSIYGNGKVYVYKNDGASYAWNFTVNETTHLK